MHVAIIMDGNGRWAERRGLPRKAGHKAGARAVRRVVEAAARSSIDCLTLYAFSSDNWARPREEVSHLMRLFKWHLQSEISRCIENGVRLNVIGRRDRLDPGLLEIIERAEAITADGKRMVLRLAVDYSARDALAFCAQRMSGVANGATPATIERAAESARVQLATALGAEMHALAPAGDMLVLPTIPFGLDEHHMDFPGTIAVDIQTTLAYLSQVAISVARHGFTHILIVNGHGSNISICDLAARECVLKTGVICAATTVNAAVNPALVADVLDAERKGGWGSVGHACEYETAMYLVAAAAGAAVATALLTAAAASIVAAIIRRLVLIVSPFRGRNPGWAAVAG